MIFIRAAWRWLRYHLAKMERDHRKNWIDRQW